MAQQRPKVSVLDFFKPKPVERVQVRRGQTDGRTLPSNDISRRTPLQSTRARGKEYVEEFQKKLELEESSSELNLPSSPIMMVEDSSGSVLEKSVDGVEGLSTLGVSRTAFEVDGEELTDVYTKFDFTPVQPKGLVIEKSKDKILQMVESNQVVIIEGATGCGKSTQVPQYILDQHASRNLPCNIVVTQPRRIAATSIAKWVCKDRKWEVGDVVGYQIGLEVKSTPNTRLLFCTTGVLLEKLICLKDMNKYTHVILDEVHERNQDMDFLMLLVRKLLKTNSKNVKVILMSATFDTSRFAKYFAMQMNNILVDAPVVEVQLLGAKFKISEFYLDDLGKIAPLPQIDFGDPGVTADGKSVCQKLLTAFENLDRKDFENEFGRQVKETDHYRHCVLIFLPGLRDIEEMFNHLGGEDNKNQWHLLPLHSSLTRDEQQRVFEPVRIGFRKVVLCTDIAESSVTVPDVKYVIDFCLTKELIADPLTNFTSLQLRWASRTNCKQRAGRTGRVMNGRVYRIVYKSFFYDQLYEDKEPEILRCPLEIVVLKCKILDIGEPRAVLSLALDPPDISNIERAILLLKEAGALLATCHGRPVRFDGDITFLGRVMAALPLNIQVSKLIALGHLFCLLNDTIVIGAMLSVQNIFTTPFMEQIKAYNSKLKWADGSCSDAVAYLNTFTLWKHLERNGYFRSEARSEKRFCTRYYINPKGLREANELVTEVTTRLKEMNIFADSIDGAAEWSKEQKPLILKTLIAGAFYPNYFLRGAQGGQIDEKDALKKVGGHDSRRSVFLTGMPPEQPGMLYAKAVRQALDDCGSQMQVYFEASKYIVEFDRFDGDAEGNGGRRNCGPLARRNDREENSNLSSTIPGGINMAVYRAVKRRLAKLPVEIGIMRLDRAKQLAEDLGIVQRPSLFDTPRPREVSNIPGPEVIDIEFAICELQHPGRFWIQLVLHRAVIDRLYTTLNAENNLCPLSKEVEVGDVVAAPYDFKYYRAKVLRLDRMAFLAEVSFIDYGTTGVVGVNELREVKEIPLVLWNNPPFALEARLCEVSPSFVKNKNNIWSEEATEFFRQKSYGVLKGKIYSIVDNVIALTIDKGEADNTLNKILVEESFAEEAIEDIRSRSDHDYRSKVSLSTDGCVLQSSLNSCSNILKEVDPPPKEDCSQVVVLKGPFSPLEMQVYGCMKSTSAKQIRLDPQSVNSVLLDSNPEDSHERLLVGAVVTQPGEDRNYLTIRNTTLMPNIHGLPPLMALVFAPNVELRTNIAETVYIDVLCGLGYDPRDNSSLFPENDLCMTFDVVIDEEDLNIANRIRFWMSYLLRTDEGETLPSISVGERREGQLNLKKYLMELLMKKRKPQALSFDSFRFEWNHVKKEKIVAQDEDDERFVFKLIRRQVLSASQPISEHIQELLQLIKNPPEGPVDAACKLCNVKLTSVPDIVTHIHLQSHRDREAEEYEE